MEGTLLGWALGSALIDGSKLGLKLGRTEGSELGRLVGCRLGFALIVGSELGCLLGLEVGLLPVGDTLGFALGLILGSPLG